jgi:PucR C-terminal helix-turn-helix domain
VRHVFDLLAQAGANDLLRCRAVRGFDTTATAAALPVHRNTLLYRISRIQALTGLSLKDQRDPTLVQLAVIWQDISGSVLSVSYAKPLTVQSPDEPAGSSAGAQNLAEILDPPTTARRLPSRT